MKKITLYLIAGLFCLVGVAQGQDYEMPKNAVRIGVNRVFFGSGDILGTGVYAEYSYSLNEYFALTPRIMSANANRNSEASFDQASSFASSLALRISPFPNAFRRLKIDIGGLYHKFINSYGGIREKTPYGQYLSNSTTYSNEDLFGLIGSLSINVLDNKKIESGLRVDMLTSFTEGYFNSDSMQAGVYFGVKF